MEEQLKSYNTFASPPRVWRPEERSEADDKMDGTESAHR